VVEGRCCEGDQGTWRCRVDDLVRTDKLGGRDRLSRRQPALVSTRWRDHLHTAGFPTLQNGPPSKPRESASERFAASR
jgi:hypothetical protein